MANRNTAIRGLQIRDAFFGNGLQRNSGDNDIAEIKLDGATLALSASGIKVADAGIGTTQLATDSVTNDILANMTRGTVKVGGASDAPTDLDAKTDGYILIGDGTDIASVAVSGDITITNAGVTAIGADKVTAAMINADVAGDGIAQNVSGALDLDLNELTDAAVDVAADSIAIVDATDNSSKKESIADLVTAMAGSGLTATNGVLSVDSLTNNVTESDIQMENESANCNGATTDFTLSNTPLANSVQVYLNGLLQEDGSGKDYQVSGTTVSFAEAPLTGDILIIHYIIDNA